MREVQRVLNAWYPSLPQLAVDGDFGPATDGRVRYMQGRAGLDIDGIVGPQTWRRLLGLALVALVVRGWVRLGEIEAELLAADIELAERD